ncbi:hypothetical protein [Ectopseudomonas oleovorans]|uniref:hypothetical protein n=1 Tax=Ectopseudomonas oleovorans TaxID=301 RepID=UPI0035B12826
MSGISVSRTNDGEALPIVSPGARIGGGNLADSTTILVSNPVQGTAIYLFCKSVIHVGEGTVSADSAPIDARGGVYLDVNRNRSIAVKLLDGEPAAEVWMHEVR